MDKGWGPPQPFTTCKWTRVGGPQPFTTCKWTRVGGSPNPSRLANGQGLGAPPTLHDLQMDKGWGPPKPFTTCKWTRVGGSQPFTTCKWTKIGGPPPTLHDLQMDKGWGPPKPFTTCKWTRVGGPPNPSRLKPFTTCKWTRVGGPSTPHDLGRQGPQPFTTRGGGTPSPSPKIGKAVTGPFGSDLPPNPKPKFCSWCNVGLWLGRIWFGWLDGLPRCE